MIYEAIGKNIKLFRKEFKMTQSELAELIGVSMQAVSKWETDAGMPDISQIIPLARVLGTSTDMILGDLDDGHLKEAEYIRASESVERRGSSMMPRCCSLRHSIIVAEVISRRESKREMTA